MDVRNIPVGKTVSKILDYDVILNVDVPVAYNSLILEKWEEFQIAERIQFVAS